MASISEEETANVDAANVVIDEWGQVALENAVRFFKILLEWENREDTIREPYEGTESSVSESTDPGGVVRESVLEGPGA